MSKKFRLRKLTPIEKLVKARVILLKERPFFGTLVLHLRYIEADTELLKKMIPTMGIDKWGRLFYAPEFVDSLSLEELLSVVCHEVHHAVLMHLDRKMSRDERAWNFSADYVINEILKQNGFTVVDGWLHDDKYKDWYAEEIYEELMQRSQDYLKKLEKGQFDVHVYVDVDKGGKKGKTGPCSTCQGKGRTQCNTCKGSGKDPACGGTGQQGQGQGNQGSHPQPGSGQGQQPGGQSGGQQPGGQQPGGGGGQQGQGQCPDCNGTGQCPNCTGTGNQPCPDCGGSGIQQDGGQSEGYGHGFGEGDEKQMPHWDKVLKEAYTYAKQQGKAPLGMERIIEGLTKAQVPWQSIVRKFIVATLPKDYTYSLPHKRSQLAGFYIPNVKREEIDICVGIDTSGSISDDEYMEFVSEIVALDRTFKGRINFHIVTCDAEIHSVQDFHHNFDPRKLESRGYGGTMFKPVFEHIRENVKKAKLLVFFTDLYGDEDHLEKSRYSFQTLWVLTHQSNQKDPPFGQWVRLAPRDEKHDRRFGRRI